MAAFVQFCAQHGACTASECINSGIALVSLTRVAILALVAVVAFGCSYPSRHNGDDVVVAVDTAQIRSEIEEAVWAFHAADTSKNAQGVIDLLWPDFSMFADGARIEYEDVVQGSRTFMADLELFHTEWTDLDIVPLGPDAALSTFLFQDSIITLQGQLIEAKGPTTFVWQRRGDEWRVLFADADHYPVD